MENAASFPTMPRWNIERPFLTGRFYQIHDSRHSMPHITEPFRRSSLHPLGSYPTAVQELLVIEDLLSALVGIEGRYISVKRAHIKDGDIKFQIDGSADFALQELAAKMFPLCENFVMINQFIETRSHFASGLVNHAFAAALRVLLVDYQAMAAQLEHQFHIGRLSVQGLWFFCQPMMTSMHALSVVISKVSSDSCSGSAVIDLLHSQAKAMSGDNTVRSLLEKMTQCASSPYLHILERWVYEGVIHDPYGEFFIAENKLLKKESLTHDYDAKYWQQCYSLTNDIPSFLSNIAEKILITGKYLNVMRECGHPVQVPMSEKPDLTSVGSNHYYLERIKVAYDFASCELLNFIKAKYDLMGKLRSIKRYLLLEQGDLLVHFMDIAQDELNKRPDQVSPEKLQERASLLNRLSTLKDLECGMKHLVTCSSDVAVLSDINYQTEYRRIACLEAFSLTYRVQWPLSLVISKKALTKYQLIFRLLFHCEHVHRQLCSAWQVHQGVRACNTSGTFILRSSLLCRSMLKFVNSHLHYLTFEVIEPNWHVMNERLQNAKSIDEVIQYHDFFLEKCMKECLLLLPELVKKIEKLKTVCLQYAAAIQRLIPSLCIQQSCPSDTLQVLRTRRFQKSYELKFASENKAVADSVMKFEAEFNVELQNLQPILSSRANAEPYLTHLAQSILGVGNGH